MGFSGWGWSPEGASFLRLPTSSPEIGARFSIFDTQGKVNRGKEVAYPTLIYP